MAATLMAGGCLQPPDTGTGSYGYGPQAPPFAAYSPPVYQPIYQPPPLSPNLTPETVPIPAVGYAPPVRYLPPPAPSASLLAPAPSPPTSLFGPQRPGWN
ncbi:MAG: hypothetical protein EXR12_05460 [Rhodospirillaceae bacterium]|nr:hypothetical protein [Rhodospirillaceae bacterium]